MHNTTNPPLKDKKSKGPKEESIRFLLMYSKSITGFPVAKEKMICLHLN